MLYKIVNLLSTSVTVADLGILLQSGGSTTVRAEAWARSADGPDLEARRWIRVDKQFVAGARPPVPVHPRSAPPPPVAMPAPLDPPPPEPASQSGIDTPRFTGAFVSQESFDRHTKNQEEIMKMLSTLMGAVPSAMERINNTIKEMPAPAVVPFRPGMVHPHETSPVGRGADPMFIPSKIVPEDARGSIKVDEGQAEADVNSAAEALKRARGGKKP